MNMKNLKNMNMKNMKNMMNMNMKNMMNLTTTLLLIAIFILVFIVYRGLYENENKNNREGFSWTADSTQQFLKIQTAIHPNMNFDVKTIQKQASQEELDYYLRNGKWPWSDKVKELYKTAVRVNPYVRIDPDDGMNEAQTVYNEKIITEILSWQTKEGLFLLNGVAVKDASGNKFADLPSGWGDYPYSADIIKERNDVVKCGVDASGKMALQQIRYTGVDGITGVETTSVTPVNLATIKKLIPGFSFVKGQCNPCVALNNEQPDYSCPFKLDILGTQPGISSIWQYLWQVDANPLQSQPSSVAETTNVDKNVFPMLNQVDDATQNLTPTPFPASYFDLTQKRRKEDPAIKLRQYKQDTSPSLPTDMPIMPSPTEVPSSQLLSGLGTHQNLPGGGGGGGGGGRFR